MVKKEYDKYSKGKPYKVIALCVAKFHEQMTMEILKSICNRCSEANCKVMIFSTYSDFFYGERSDQGEAKFIDIFHMECFDAIVIMSETFKDNTIVKDLVDRAKNYLVPVISVDKYIEDCYNINFCYSNSFEKIVRHIVEDHHATRVNFIAGIKDNNFSEERLNCYKKVLLENDIPIDSRRIEYGDFWEDPAKQAIDNFLSGDLPLPEAIICANDMMAIAACQRLKEYGYRVPQDIIVTGFDGIELEKFHTPRLTTAEFNMEGLVDTIFRIVHDNERVIPKDYQLDYLFKRSCSCGCIPIAIEDSSDKIYEMAIQNKANIVYDEQAYRMISHLNSLNNFSEVLDEFSKYIYGNDSYHFWLCTNDNLLDDNFDFNYTHSSKRNKRKQSSFSNEMFIPIQKNRGDFKQREKVKRVDLIPNLFQILENEADYILFLPIHAEEVTVGYAASCININTFSSKNYQSLMVNFMNVLSNFKVKEERENFYSRDVLTNLYNRRGFYKYINGIIEECMEKKYLFAIVSVDMDGLKLINDFYGHKEGDFALKKIADILLRCIKKDGLVARFGGDEFILALGVKNTKKRVDKLILDIQNYLDTFNQSNKKDYPIEASFGTFMEVPVKKIKLDDFIKYADNAMYSEKIRHKRERSR